MSIDIPDNDLRVSQPPRTQRYFTQITNFRDDMTMGTNTDTACNLLVNRRNNKNELDTEKDSKPPIMINNEDDTILMTESL